MKRNCPICKTPTDSATHPEFPFCSERCRERDLGNWASEKYVVSESVFDLDGSEPHARTKQTQKVVEEDEDFEGFPKPDGTIH